MSKSYEKVRLTPAQVAALLDECEVELELATGTAKLMLPSHHEIACDQDAAEAVIRCGHAIARGIEETLDELEEEEHP